MRAQPIPVPVLIDSGIRFSWQQAVALVQAIAAAGASRSTTSTAGSESLAEFALEAGGMVVSVADDAPVLSVSQLALLLGRLLPGEDAAARERPPAGVQFAITRALGLAPAPALGSVAEFSQLLARFEAAGRSALLRDVFERYAVHANRGGLARAEELRASGSSGAVTRTGTSPGEIAALERQPAIERRRSAMTPDMARRFLREADRLRFEARKSRTTSQIAARPSPAGRGRTRRAGPYAAIGIAVIALTLGAIAEHYRMTGFGPTAPAMTPRREAIAGTPRQVAATGIETASPAERPAPRQSPNGHVTAKPVSASPATAAKAKSTRRSAPIRLLAAIRRGFLRFVHRQPRTRQQREVVETPAAY